MNGHRFPAPGEQTIAQLLVRQAREMPDATYAIFPNRVVTFGELHRAALKVAKGFMALGLEPGAHVATLMPNCPDWLPAYFGGLYAGLTVVALNARYKRHELRYAIEHSDSRVLLTTESISDHVDFVQLIGETLGGLPADGCDVRSDVAPQLRALVLFGETSRPGFGSIDSFIRSGTNVADSAVERRLSAVDPDTTAVIIYTSGTTAAPKGCELTHSGIEYSWFTYADVVDLRSWDKVWMPMPFFHTGGVGPMTAVLARGAAFMTQPHLEPEEAVALIREHEINHLYPGFPQLSLAVIQHPDYSRERYGFVRSLLNVGPPAMQRSIQEALPEGARLLNLFGMSEGSGIVTFTPFDAPLEVRAVTSGKPPAHTEVRIIHPETGELCGANEPGEIQFRGPGAFRGYYRAPEITAQTKIDAGWVRTGDRGKLDGEGWLHFLGRLKDMLKVGGENVAALEIESFLSQHPDVKMVQVIGAPDDRLGEVPVAFVERAPGGTVDAEGLIAMCQGELAKWKIPRDVVFVSEWPMSTTKVQKYRLRRLLPGRYGVEKEVVDGLK